jgi:hypothetical protein
MRVAAETSEPKSTTIPMKTPTASTFYIMAQIVIEVTAQCRRIR